MTKYSNQKAKDRQLEMDENQKRAITAALSRQSTAYDEEARRVLGSPLAYVEGRGVSEPELVTSILSVSSLKN